MCYDSFMKPTTLDILISFLLSARSTKIYRKILWSRMRARQKNLNFQIFNQHLYRLRKKGIIESRGDQILLCKENLLNFSLKKNSVMKNIFPKKTDKILISFDASAVDKRHKAWLKSVNKRIGLSEIKPQPYWGFDDLEHKAGTKLLNCFYVQAEVKVERKKEFYKYTKIMMLQKFSFKGFLKAIEKSNILVDFDARTGHNHGTKFRMRQNCLPILYEKTTIII